jgi:hypothetical protein
LRLAPGFQAFVKNFTTEARTSEEQSVKEESIAEAPRFQTTLPTAEAL